MREPLSVTRRGREELPPFYAKMFYSSRSESRTILMRNRTTSLGRFAAQFGLGSLGLALDPGSPSPSRRAGLERVRLSGRDPAGCANGQLCGLGVAVRCRCRGCCLLFRATGLHRSVCGPAARGPPGCFLLASMIVGQLIGDVPREREAARQARAGLRRSEADLRDSEQAMARGLRTQSGHVLHGRCGRNGPQCEQLWRAQLGYSGGPDRPIRAAVFLEEDRDSCRQCVAVCLESDRRVRTLGRFERSGRTARCYGCAKTPRPCGGRYGRPIVLIACEDITERKETENALRQSEAYLAQAQELSQTGSFGWSVATGEIVWSKETFRIFEFDPTTKPTLELVIRAHPSGRSRRPCRRPLDQAASERQGLRLSNTGC